MLTSIVHNAVKTATALTIAITLVTAGCAKDAADAAQNGAPDEATTAPKVTAAAIKPTEAALPTLDQVLDRHFAALGGEDKLREAQTLTYSGTFYKGDETVKVSKVYKRGHKLRVEKDDGEEKHLMVWSGDQGWKTHEGKLQQVTGDKAAHLKRAANLDDALLTYQQDGYRVELLGEAEVHGKPAYKVVVKMGERGKEVRFIDASSYFEVKRVVAWKGEEGEGSTTVYFSDYRDVGDGMMINHRVDYEGDKGAGKFIIESAAYNQPVDDATFAVDGDGDNIL